jgi:hypothetical protein
VPTNYAGNRAATQSPSAAPGIGIAPTVVIPNDGESLNVASIAQALKVLADYSAFETYELGGRNGPQWGDGSDGDVTISIDTTLTRPWFYNNLTINAAQLKPQGFWVRVKDTLTINASGGIQDSGLAAVLRTALPVSTTRAYNWVGKVGATGLTSAGIGPNAAVMGASPNFMIGGFGGQGGNASGGAGGGSGGFGAIGSRHDVLGALLAGGTMVGADAAGIHYSQLITGGGGGGAGATQDGSNQGGGGGEGGGVVFVAARRIIINGTHGGAAMAAVGGIGGTPSGANGGNGGGGGGGFVGVLCSTYSGEALTSACIAGGAVGTGGVATGASGGNAGAFKVFILGS